MRIVLHFACLNDKRLAQVKIKNRKFLTFVIMVSVTTEQIRNEVIKFSLSKAI